MQCIKKSIAKSIKKNLLKKFIKKNYFLIIFSQKKKHVSYKKK